MNRNKRIGNILLAVLLTLGVALSLGIGGAFAKISEIMTAGEPYSYIYFDLAAGNVIIGKNSYSGWIYVDGVAKEVKNETTRTGNEKFYVYQSNPSASESSPTHPKNTGYKTETELKAKTNCRVPSYLRVQYAGEAWTEYITNNTNVEKVSQNWETAAEDSGRKPLGEQAKNKGAASSGNRIIFNNESNYEADVTIDNIWTYYQTYGNSRNTGGITAHLRDSTDTKICIRLKGDNRFGNVHYGAYENSRNQIIFLNGDSEATPGSITVADFPEDLGKNHWASAIGGDDSVCDRSDGIVIESGVIYAGTTAADNCTALGGGGNEYGRVTINNGKVTAIAATTGTAIGGGIGWGGAGGNTDVTINNGEVYAYNFGIDNSSTDKFKHYVPAVAIGGGSSQDSGGNARTTVTITGGFVYAQCMGGAAIGGGGSASNAGGSATINITGGVVIAKSTSGRFKGTADPDFVDISAGVSIGGGTGLTAGGSVTLNISGEDTILRAGSIGGGSATGKDADGNPYKAGNATVNVSGGNIIGQIIMAGGAANPCSFTMTKGTIHSTNVIDGVTIGNTNITGVTITDPQPDVPLSFIRQDGGAVFMNDPQGVAIITGGLIGNCTANKGGAIYMAGGKFILSGTGQLGTNHAKEDGGSVYVGGGTVQIGGGVTLAKGTVLVAENSEDASKCAIRNSDAAQNGGGVYVGNGTVDIKGGSIRDNTANENGGGMYVGNGNITLSGKMSPKAEIVEENGKKYFTISTTSIKGNKATNNGGGMFVDKGNITIKSGEINYNESLNGAGMYVGNGTVTMSNGSIHDNTATKSGGGMYVSGTADSGTSDNVIITGGSVKFNKAADNGGGMFVDQGNITINSKQREYETNPFISTEISYNTATKDGGGVFVTGDVYMLNGSVTKNSAVNGGGFCVEDGTVLMYGGSIDHNSATENGGGMHVSTTNNDALVDIFSGSISNNTAKNGGGVSVLSTSDKPINVTVGVNCEHPNLNPAVDANARRFDPFSYQDENGAQIDCGEAHTGHTHNHISEVDQHSSCPVVENNTAVESGGGFYLKSSQSYLTFYCVTEQGNKANKNSRCDNMDVEGGHVEIGDKSYDQTNPVKGNIIMQSSILVNSGTVDIYGTMVNPDFTDDVTVDIKKDSDYYIDHRLTNQAEIEYYKVHYYENFKGDGDKPTGLYIARQYPDLDHGQSLGDAKYDFTIMSSIFSHPGYKIVGWNSKPDDSGDKYEVNKTYNLKKLDNAGKVGAINSAGVEDKSLLVIYAIWERSGYVLKFDPNVGEGETYTGTMENQRVTVGLLDGTQKISQNQFKRLGYRFIGWTLTPTPIETDTVYEDGQNITENFTEEDGATVTLYANWVKCTHVDYLVYTANGNILTQSCSACGGHTAMATLSAVNAVYDGNTHLATVNFSVNWLGNKPEISYEMAASEWDGKDTAAEDWQADPHPLHAGNYTAKLTAGDATAQAEYVISPVKWTTPAVPQISFTVKKVDATTYNSVITITTPIGDNLMYKITHLPNDGTETGVEGYLDWQSETKFANIPYGKYYYFYAKVCADRDHIESDPSKSAAYLTTGGNIIYIENGEGIKVVPQYGTGEFKYIVSAADGYHLRGYKDNLTDNEMVIGPTNLPDFVKKIPGVEDGDAVLQDGGIKISKSDPADGTYTYTVKLEDGLVAYHQITLKFSGAAKNATVASKVTDGEVFVDFNGKETSISRDSAFTVQFTVSNYIPDEYTEQALRFSTALPKNTTIILKTDNKYWYYILEAADASINLTDFIEMGGEAKFTFDRTGAVAKTFTYQFIVDFSKAAVNSITDSLEVSLELTADTPHGAPNIPTVGNMHISLGIKEKAAFNLNSASVEGKTTTLNCTYNPSAGAASIWNGRKTALVLTVPDNAPADLKLTAVVDGKTTLYTMNSSRMFIIPLGEVGTKEVKITLNSDLFGSSELSLALTAKWYVSQGGADRSPLNGYSAANCNVAFSCKKDTVPSIRIDGFKRLCHAGEQLQVIVNYAGIPSEGTVTAYLQSKNGEQYVDTGAKVSITTDADISKQVEFNMGQMAKGSYRILVVVQESGANILQVPYYFVIA